MWRKFSTQSRTVLWSWACSARKRAYILGCTLSKDSDGNIQLSILEHIFRVKPMSLSKARRRGLTKKGDNDETRSYHKLSGTLLCIAKVVLTHVCLAASKTKQLIGRLWVSELVEANGMVKELLNLTPFITFVSSSIFSDVSLNFLSDVSPGVREVYVPSGILPGLRIFLFSESAYHHILWTSHK